jgi:hypothetical protein
LYIVRLLSLANLSMVAARGPREIGEGTEVACGKTPVRGRDRAARLEAVETSSLASEEES